MTSEISPPKGHAINANRRLKARCASTGNFSAEMGNICKSSAAKPASGSASTHPVARTSKLTRVIRRASGGLASVATTGGMAPPRFAPSMGTTTRPGEAMPLAANKNNDREA